MHLNLNIQQRVYMFQVGKCMYEGFNSFLTLLAVVADPEAAEVLLKSCLDKDDVTKFFRVLLGNGSIFAPGMTINICQFSPCH